MSLRKAVMDIISSVNNPIPMRVIYIPKCEININYPDATENKDIIEFYDSRYPQTLDGQFISRYYVETFLMGDKCCGLILDDVGDWKIDRETKEMIINWIKYLRKEKT